jgi:hypothetical protein
MSQGVAAARKRRAPASLQPPPPPQISTQQQSQQQPGQGIGLTLPQVIALVDKRLTIVESFMTESKTTGLSNNVVVNSSNDSMMEELNARCVMLAEEIINLKNIVLNLQSYTMEVNKTLMEERVRILSDVVENEMAESS